MELNRRTDEPLGILRHLSITLGGKTIYIDVMVVQGPLDFNFFLGWDYVYSMEVVVSTLFQVMHFPHDGNIVTLHHISFVSINHSLNIDHTISLNFPYMKGVSPLPQLFMLHHVPFLQLLMRMSLLLYSHLIWIYFPKLTW
jgi:hypothetical protein